jgi:HD-like signal output (HDOD) protein
MILERWLERLRPGQTPIFRHTKDSLLALQDRIDAVSAREVANLVLADPLASLRLIYLANNRVSRHFGNQVATVEHAIMMQGLGVYVGQVAGYPVLEETALGRDPDTLASLYRLLRLAQHAAWQARDFAVLHSDIRAEEVEVAALLYYAPEFLFWLDAPETARELARLRRIKEPVEAETEALGFALEPLRLMLLEAWKIPEVIRDQLSTQYAHRSRNIILKACLDLAHRSRHGWWDEHLLADYQALADIENTPLEVIIATAHRNAVRAARHGAWIPAPPAAAWLPMLPGPWPHEQPVEEAPNVSAPAPVQPAAPAAAAPSPREATAPDAGAARRAEAQVCMQPDQAALQACLQGIEAHLDGSLNLNQMLALVLKGLHHGLGLSRVVFAMVTPDGQRVKSRFTLGVGAQEPLRHFEFPLHSKDLFGHLMTKMQGVWLNADNQARLWPMIRPELRVMLGEGDFLAMSLFVGDRPFGLIYADRGRTGCRLDAATYTDFKRLCLQAARGLAKIKSG